MQKTVQDLHIMHERNEFENIPILVKERGDAFWGIPNVGVKTGGSRVGVPELCV